MIVYYPSLTVLDLIYFVGEIGIIALLVFMEYKVALVKALNKDDSKLK
jgi:hypothetical protein